MNANNNTLGLSHDDDDRIHGGFGCGTELSDEFAAQKEFWNREHRLEHRRGRSRIVSKGDDHRLLYHLNPRTLQLTEEHQQRDVDGKWQRISIMPSTMTAPPPTVAMGLTSHAEEL